jgi:hypothetical protein
MPPQAWTGAARLGAGVSACSAPGTAQRGTSRWRAGESRERAAGSAAVGCVSARRLIRRRRRAAAPPRARSIGKSNGLFHRLPVYAHPVPCALDSPAGAGIGPRGLHALAQAWPERVRGTPHQPQASAGCCTQDAGQRRPDRGLATARLLSSGGPSCSAPPTSPWARRGLAGPVAAPEGGLRGARLAPPVRAVAHPRSVPHAAWVTPRGLSYPGFCGACPAPA